MDAAKLQSKIYKGYDKAAQRIGFMSDVYRPATVSNAVAVGNKIASLNASFNAEDMRYSRPNKYGHPTWWCLVDGSNLRVGDYIKNSHDGTFFIAAMQQALPILVVSCNAVINVLRPVQQTGKGAVGYNADTVATEVSRITAFPASILAAGTGDRNGTLPSDTKYPQFSVLLPSVQNVEIRTSDIINDDIGRRFIVISAELTDLGWRLIVMQAVA